MRRYNYISYEINGVRAHILDKTEWSRWLPSQNLNFKDIPPSSGVYQIRWAIDGQPQPISRVDGIDKKGLLYIGKANNIYKRIRDFWRYIRSEKGKHTAGYTYVFYDYERKFRPNQLEVRWAVLPKDEIDDAETKLLDNYLDKYLDSPPLNISIKRPS